MANILFTTRTNGGWLPDFYDATTLDLTDSEAKKIVFTDKNGLSVVFTGSGFKTSKDGAVTAGTATTLSFLNEKGALLMSVSVKNESFDAKALYASFADNGSIYNLLSLISAGADTITGSSGDDQLMPAANLGDDTILGNAGEDYIAGSAGNNTMDGGADFDTLSYQDTLYDKSAKKGIVLDATKGTVQNSWSGTDKISNFENYRGSHLADRMKGNATDEQLSGLGGKDVIDGGAGFDTLRFERDARYGGAAGVVVDLAKGTAKDGFGLIDTIKNIEGVRGTVFADKFTGNGEDNSFRGYDGKDTFNGGAGTDSVAFLTGNYAGGHGVTVDMTRSSLQVRDDGFGNAETLISIENIQGGEFADVITLGKGRSDVWGNDGNDRIIAGSGENSMSGNGGADTFVFLTAAASKAGTTTRDFIEDFSRAQGDKVDLSAVANLTFKGKSGHVDGMKTVAYSYNSDGNTIVGADVNGDGKADLQFLLAGKIAFTASDFIL